MKLPYFLLAIAGVLVFLAFYVAYQDKDEPVKVGQIWYVDLSTPWNKRIQSRTVLEVKAGWVKYVTDRGTINEETIGYFMNMASLEHPK